MTSLRRATSRWIPVRSTGNDELQGWSDEALDSRQENAGITRFERVVTMMPPGE